MHQLHTLGCQHCKDLHTGMFSEILKLLIYSWYFISAFISTRHILDNLNFIKLWGLFQNFFKIFISIFYFGWFDNLFFFFTKSQFKQNSSHFVTCRSFAMIFMFTHEIYTLMLLTLKKVIKCAVYTARRMNLLNLMLRVLYRTSAEFQTCFVLFYYSSRILQTQTNQLRGHVSFPVGRIQLRFCSLYENLSSTSGTESSSLSDHHSSEYFSYPSWDSSEVKRWGFELNNFFLNNLKYMFL